MIKLSVEFNSGMYEALGSIFNHKQAKGRRGGGKERGQQDDTDKKEKKGEKRRRGKRREEEKDRKKNERDMFLRPQEVKAQPVSNHSKTVGNATY